MFNPETISSFPTSPGVYIMKNAAGDILYVGKAANLRNRVRNYFTATGDNRFTVQFLVRNVVTIDTIVTATEKDAFLLENNLIKKHRPRYNIRLRDDKTYLSLRFRMNHPFPRLETTRVRRAELGSAGSTALGSGEALMDGQGKKGRGRAARDPDIYFGPFTSSGAVRETLRFLLKIFPVRTCRDSYFKNRTRPCILYDVGKCCGPCTEPVSQDYYNDLIQRVATFFNGKDDEVRRTLQVRMEELAEAMEFEKAALVRDRLEALDRTLESHQSESHLGGDRDIIAIASAQGRSLVVLQQFRRGVLLHSTDFYTKNYEQEDGEVLYSFISQQYVGMGQQIPAEILVSAEPQDRELLEEWLREERGGAVRVHVPQRGKLNAMAHTARQNARMGLNRRLGGEKTREETLQELSDRLMLDHPPRTIECLDISNIMGVLAVGSIVRFEDGEPDKSGYRLYRIRTVEGSNDFGMIREVMMRRFRPDSDRAREFPDLFIVDGGKGQLNVAEDVFRELGINNVALAGMAKSRLKVRTPKTFPGVRSGAAAELRRAAEQAQAMADGAGTGDKSPEGGDELVNDYFPDAPDYTGDEREAEGPVEIKARERFRPLTVQGYGKEEKIRFRTEERIFLPGRKNPVTFATNSPALFLLERIRDETRRTAITYHRKLRQKTNRKSVLDEVPGVGPKRKKLLLRHFGSLAALKQASVDEIAGVPGVGQAAGRNVYDFLQAQENAGVQEKELKDENAEAGITSRTGERIEIEEEFFVAPGEGDLSGLDDDQVDPDSDKPEDLLDPGDRRKP